MLQLRGFAILMLLWWNHSVFGQQCSQIGSNPICSQEAAAQGSMIPFTFQEGCFSATMNYCFYLETGGQAGPAVLAVQREDCDYILVNPVTGTATTALDSIFVTIVGFPDGGDPCDQSNYNYQSSCYLFTTQTTFLNVPNLPTNSSLMVVVGSNHDPLFGPCSIKIQASGTPFELNTTVDPIFIYAGQEAYLTCEGASVGADYAWTPDEFVSNPTAANTAAFPTESTNFFVTSSIGSCTVTDSVNVPVGVPISYGNAISPNGDYINDEWTIKGIEKFERAEVSVFDRWGQSVFHSIGYGSPWNGTNRGKVLPTGPYYYVIELNSPVVYIKPLTGYISIVR
jgi:gliding motility-associated-like protein